MTFKLVFNNLNTYHAADRKQTTGQKCHKIFKNVTKSSKMSQNLQKFHKIFQNFTKSSQNLHKIHEIFKNVNKSMEFH